MTNSILIMIEKSLRTVYKIYCARLLTAKIQPTNTGIKSE